MTRKPPPDDSNLLHLRATPAPVRREVTEEPPEARHAIRPRVSIDTRGAPIVQVVHGGVEWAVDHTSHADDGAELTLTVRGPLRSLEHGDRAEQAVRLAAEVVRRIRRRSE